MNQLQNVPYTINRPVLEVLTQLYEAGERVKKMPRALFREKARPADFDRWPTERQQKWERKAKHEAQLIRYKNVIEVPAQRLHFEQTLKTATLLATEYDRFYIPVNVDFRGRVVPIPTFHYQLADPFRALFKFAEGKPLGQYGCNWLMIHLANCGDFRKVSKKPFSERIKWVEEHRGEILATAWNPMGSTWWRGADTPFQFLAACFEYAEASLLEDPRAYVSHLPIGLDGSNNGLQHYSAIMRSRDESKLVNLLNLEQPQDIYGIVAAAVTKAIEKEDGQSAEKWRAHGITRSTVKRCVMTSLYGSEEWGFKDHLMDDLTEPLAEEVLDGKREAHPLEIGEDGGLTAARYMAKKVAAALGDILTKTDEARQWLRKTVSALTKAGHHIQWKTPIGLPVVLHKEQLDAARMELLVPNLKLTPQTKKEWDRVAEDGETVLDRAQVTLRIEREEHGKLSPYKQRNGIAPNCIHSFDAAHLMLTMEAAANEGIGSVLTVHDSYATHAGDTERFSRLIREQFARMYTNHDPLEEIRRYAEGILSEPTAPLPTKGDLDLREVEGSSYFFA
jgi:DNA-directed RNA polymerase